MNITRLPICYYPTTTILIDDNENFLNQISNFLKTKNFPCVIYNDPKKALHYINEEYQSNPFANRCINVDPDRNLDSFSMLFDYRKIHHEIYNPQRYQQISVIVVDYAMPAQDGLSVCKQVKDELALKLLLTGEVGSTFAVKAFNEGAINKFIRKGATDLPEIFIENLQDLQHKYFLNLSEAILTKVKSDLFKQSPVCLNDPAFIAVFTKIFEDNQIVEYYLLDEHGSFLMLDSEGNPSWLIVKNEQDMQSVVEQANDQHAQGDILDALTNRAVIPYFHTEDDWEIGYDEDEVKRCLHPASKLVGKQMYYYSYVKHPDSYKLESNCITALAQHLSLSQRESEEII